MSRYDRFCRNCRHLYSCRGHKYFRPAPGGKCAAFAPTREAVQAALDFLEPFAKERRVR